MLKRHKRHSIAAAIVAVFYVPIARAEWTGKGELGVVIARGNTDTQTVTVKGEAMTKTDAWKHLVGFSALRSTSSNARTADRYEAHGQTNYNVSARSYVLGSLRYENDGFSTYRHQSVASLGYGVKYYDSETTRLSVELGLGYRRAEDRLTAEMESQAIGRGAMNYEHKLTSNAGIFDKFLMETGSDNTFIQNELGVNVAINAVLALRVAYLIRYNTEVDPPLVHTDELLTASLAVSL